VLSKKVWLGVYIYDNNKIGEDVLFTRTFISVWDVKKNLSNSFLTLYINRYICHMLVLQTPWKHDYVVG